MDRKLLTGASCGSIPEQRASPTERSIDRWYSPSQYSAAVWMVVQPQMSFYLCSKQDNTSPKMRKRTDSWTSCTCSIYPIMDEVGFATELQRMELLSKFHRSASSLKSYSVDWDIKLRAFCEIRLIRHSGKPVCGLTQLTSRTASHHISVRQILMWASYLHRGIQNGLFLWKFPTKILYSIYFTVNAATYFAHPIILEVKSNKKRSGCSLWWLSQPTLL